MALYATTGTKIFIGAALAAKADDLTEADFAGQKWTQIGSMENIGQLGDSAAEVTFDDIGKGRTQTLKGPRKAAPCEVVMGIDYADPGQIALIAAEKTPYDFAFMFEFNDKPAGAKSTNSKRLFIAKVMSAAEALETASNVMKFNASLAVNSNVVRVNATAGA